MEHGDEQEKGRELRERQVIFREYIRRDGDEPGRTKTERGAGGKDSLEKMGPLPE
jgi:hypothetical protein